jgi:hypothetical protein
MSENARDTRDPAAIGRIIQARQPGVTPSMQADKIDRGDFGLIEVFPLGQSLVHETSRDYREKQLHLAAHGDRESARLCIEKGWVPMSHPIAQIADADQVVRPDARGREDGLGVHDQA